MNWLDKALLAVSPQLAFRRAQARAAYNIFEVKSSKRRFEGASKGRRMDGWITPSTSQNTEINGSLISLRDRSRDLTRNNPYGAAAIQEISSNVVGTGIVGQVVAASKLGRGRVDNLQALWREWSESVGCDADGRLNLYGLQDLAMRGVVEGGEMLVRRVYRTDGSKIPLRLQLLEPDHIHLQRNEYLPNGNRIIQGVEFDPRGVRVAYYLYPQHPGDQYIKNFVPVRVPASDVLSVYRTERAGQVHGVPWSACVLVKLHEFDQYDDFQLVKQKVAACFSGFVRSTDMDPTAAGSAAIGQLTEKLEPGLIQYLGPGEDVSFANPPSVDGYRDVADVSLHAVATGFGVTFESLTGDYSRVNFSSGRMGWIKFHRNVEQWRWLTFIPQFCDPIFKWFLEAATVAGERTEGLATDWTPPRRELIDPTKEIAAQVDQIRSGLKSRSAIIRENGDDPLRVVTEIAADNEKADALKLVLDCDPRKVQKSGGIQMDNTGGKSNANEGN